MLRQRSKLDGSQSGTLHRRNTGIACAVVSLACAAVFLPGCTREETLVSYKPFFSGLSGAQMQTQPVSTKDSTTSSITGRELAAEEDLFQAVITNPDGSKTLQSKTGLQLMFHIQSTLMDNEHELFVEQVLSEITRREYAERGLDVRDAFDRLKKHERDIAKLFSRMPLGENSPNVIMEPLGANMFRIRVTGPASRDIHYRGFDMVLENGNWRLRWFV